MNTTHPLYHVVKNDAGQYAIWPEHLPIPDGWFDQQVSGTEAECAAHIDTVWLDMRPAS